VDDVDEEVDIRSATLSDRVDKAVSGRAPRQPGTADDDDDEGGGGGTVMLLLLLVVVVAMLGDEVLCR